MWNTSNTWKELFCRHEIQIREDKSAEHKTNPYQW